MQKGTADHCVYAPADAARADIERAMLSKDFTKLKIIKDKSLFSDKYDTTDGLVSSYSRGVVILLTVESLP